MNKCRKPIAFILSVLFCFSVLQICAAAIELQDENGTVYLVEQTKGAREGDLPAPADGTMTAQKSGELQEDGTVKITIETKAAPLTTYDPVDVAFIVDESGSMNMLSQYTNYPMPCLNDEHWYRLCPAQMRTVYNVSDEEFQYNVEHLENGERLLSDVYVNLAGHTIQSVQTSSWGGYKDDFVAAFSEGVYADGAPVITELYVKQPVSGEGSETEPDETQYEWVLSSSVIHYAAVNVYVGASNGNDDYETLCYEHYVLENGAFRKIDLPHSYDTGAPAWSPTDDNPDGCIDRMMLSKQAIRTLIEQIWQANPSSRVAYAGFASSLTHGVDFTDYATEQSNGNLLAALTDYSGYGGTGPAHGTRAVSNYMNNRSAETKSRDTYVIYLSDGKPQSAYRAWTPWYYTYPYPVIWREATVYAIGMDMFTDQAAKDSITGFATADPYFYGGNIANAFFTTGREELEDVLGIIKSSMYSTYPTGTLTDKIGDDFELVADAQHPISIGEHKITSASAVASGYNADTATFTWETTELPEQTYSFYVKPKELTAGTFLTNADVETDGTLTTGAVLQYHPVTEVDNRPVLSDEVQELQLPSPEITIRRAYNVRYEFVGEVPPEAEGLLPEQQSYYSGDDVTVAMSLRTLNGYRFSGWSNQEGAATLTDDGKMPEADVVFFGSWEAAATYTLRYEYEGTVIPADAEALLPATEYHCAGETVAFAQAPAADGYIFSGWRYKIDSAQLTDGKMPSADVTLVGSWVTEQTYEVRYEFTGDVPADAAQLLPGSAQHHAGDSVAVAGAPQLEKYTFTGWSTVDATVAGAAFDMPEHDVLFVGSWVAKPTYEVRYEFTGDVPADAAQLLPGSAQHYAGDSVAVAGAPQMEGYTFTGWSTVDAAVAGAAFDMPEHDVLFVGAFEKITYSGTRSITFFAPDRVSFVIDGIGYIVDSETIDVDANLTVRFKPSTSFGKNGTLVYVDGVFVTPDAEGWYTIKPGTDYIIITVTPGKVDPETEKPVTLWEKLIEFVKHMFGNLAKLFTLFEK